MSEWNYVVTAHKPTSVTRSCAGNFTSIEELNLIIAKFSLVEIYLLTAEGLEHKQDVPVYGKVATLELFRPRDEEQDLLFIATERYQYCMLGWDAETSEVVRRMDGDFSAEATISEVTGLPVDTDQISFVGFHWIGIVFLDHKLIALHLDDGWLKVIPFDGDGKLKKAFSFRFEVQVLDIKFLYGYNKPTLAVLYEGNRRYLKTYEVPLEKDPQIEHMSCLATRALYDNDTAFWLIPVPLPLCGVLVIGEKAIVYYDTSTSRAKQIKCKIECVSFKSSIREKAYGQLDADKFLLGDHNGILHLLELTHYEKNVTGLKINQLRGETSIASTISYLAEGLVYIGSSYGDSQLVKINIQPEVEDYSMEVKEFYDNLGPIMDFCVVADMEKKGQDLVVTCSGGYKDGSLRIVRHGIGVHEEVSVELEGIKGMWSLKSTTDDPYDSFLVVSFIGNLVVFDLSCAHQISRSVIEGFSTHDETLFCHCAVYGQLVQVTSKSVRLVCSTSQILKREWLTTSCSVNAATANTTQVLLATGSQGAHNQLVYLKIGDGGFTETKSAEIEYTISCLDISPMGKNIDSSSIAAVGVWEQKVIIYTIPKFTLINMEELGGDAIPRSVLMCSFEGAYYLLCAMSDGHLLHFVLDVCTGALTGRKKVSLGNQPITLRAFSCKEATRVFAISDRPTVIYSRKKELLFRDLYLEKVTNMCPLNGESFPNRFAIAIGDQLSIASIDERPKLHSRKIPLHEHARRISHQELTRTYAICSGKFENGVASAMFVRLLDDVTFGSKSALRLDQYEYGCSIVSCSFTDDSKAYYCVGTAYVLLGQDTPNTGRILVLGVVDSALQLIAQRKTDGAVYSLNAFNGGLLAAINRQIQLYKWVFLEDGGSKELQLECQHLFNVGQTLFVQTRQDLIVVGHSVRSIAVLNFKGNKSIKGKPKKKQELMKGIIQELACDYSAKWMSAVDILENDLFLGATCDSKLFTVKGCSEDVADEQQGRFIKLVGQYDLGEVVNRFRYGSLALRLSDSERASIIYGTTNGVVGVIFPLTREQYQFSLKLQTKLREVIMGVGELRNEQCMLGCALNFVNGDLIESFLDLSTDLKEEIAREMLVPPEDLTERVEELHMLHRLNL